jgi:hypothetical protein
VASQDFAKIRRDHPTKDKPLWVKKNVARWKDISPPVFGTYAYKIPS